MALYGSASQDDIVFFHKLSYKIGESKQSMSIDNRNFINKFKIKELDPII